MWISKAEYEDITARLNKLESSVHDLEVGQNIEIKRDVTGLLGLGLGMMQIYNPRVKQKDVILAILDFLGLKLKYKCPVQKNESVEIVPIEKEKVEQWK